MEWTNDIWLAIASAFLIGAILSYVVVRATNANVQKQQR